MSQRRTLFGYTIEAGKIFGHRIKHEIGAHRIRTKHRRSERARIVKAIIQSNLPMHVKERELAKLKQTRIQKFQREALRKSRLPAIHIPRFFRHKKPEPKVRFGTEAEHG